MREKGNNINKMSLTHSTFYYLWNNKWEKIKEIINERIGNDDINKKINGTNLEQWTNLNQ